MNKLLKFEIRNSKFETLLRPAGFRLRPPSFAGQVAGQARFPYPATSDQRPATSDRSLFTLVELVVSMAVFAILMMVMINIFTASQRVWTAAAARTEMFENARIALDLIARDLQSVHYENGKVPFWHKPMVATTDNEMLAFVAKTPTPHSDTLGEPDCEVKYQLAYHDTMNGTNAGWLMRSVTTNSDGDKWSFKRENGWNDVGLLAGWDAAPVPDNWPDNSAGYPVVGPGGGADDWMLVFTQSGSDIPAPTTDSSAAWQRFIPHVTRLEFVCINQAGNPIPNSVVGDPDNKPADYYIDKASPLPYMVMIRLSLLDRNSWIKWDAMGGLPHQPLHNPGGEDPRAKEFREENERTFTKMVLIGDRGQY